MNHADYIVKWLRSFAEEEAKLYGLTDHLETSDHNASVAADIIELQQHQIVELQAKVVMMFSHTDIPEFSQGFDPAEVLDVVTAERCASLVASIGNQATLIRDLQAQLAAKGEPVAKVNAARLEHALVPSGYLCLHEGGYNHDEIPSYSPTYVSGAGPCNLARCWPIYDLSAVVNAVAKESGK